MLLYPLPLPKDKYLYSPTKMHRELILCQSVQDSSPEAEVLTVFTFAVHVFHYKLVCKQLCCTSCDLCMEEPSSSLSQMVYSHHTNSRKKFFFPFAHIDALNTTSLSQARAMNPKQ